ncbi:hypothetical protein [Embleya sp. NPDC001921]
MGILTDWPGAADSTAIVRAMDAEHRRILSELRLLDGEIEPAINGWIPAERAGEVSVVAQGAHR